MSAKPKVAFFSFTSCEGCQLVVLEQEPVLLDIINAVDIVSFREAITEHSDDYQIAFCEGSISTPHDMEEIQKIREQADLIVALGACAHTGGLNSMKNQFGMDSVRKRVYGESGEWFDTIQARPISAVVDVDVSLPGCPIDGTEFLWAVKSLLRGDMPVAPQIPVCVECRLKGNVCTLVDKKKACLGPLTIGGCGAICPSYSSRCEGCRGFLADAEKEAHAEVLKEKGYSAEEVALHYRLFNSYEQDQAEK